MHPIYETLLNLFVIPKKKSPLSLDKGDFFNDIRSLRKRMI